MAMRAVRFFSNALVSVLFSQNLTFAQQSGLVKEEIFQVFDTVSGNWNNQELTGYAYNAAGWFVGLEKYFWDDQKSAWRIGVKISHRKDLAGRVTDSHYRYYDRWSGALTSETLETNRYAGSKLISSIREEIDPTGNSRQVYLQEWRYDEFDRLIYYLSESWTDGNMIFKSTSALTYDERGCLVKTINAGGAGTEYDSFSNKTEFICDGNCEVLESRTEDKNGFPISRQKYERDVDTHGRLIRIATFTGVPPYMNVFQFESESRFSYNDQGLVIFSIHSSASGKTRHFYEYNDLGNILSSTYENYDTLTGQWKILSEYSNTYDEEQRVIFYQTIGYGMPDNPYQSSYYSQSYFYDEEGLLSGVTEYYEGYEDAYLDTSWTKIRVKRTTAYSTEYRCDGASSAFYITTTHAGDIPSFSRSRILYSYFDLAPCERIPDIPKPITIYPNPARDYFHIMSNVPLGSTTVSLVDRSGKTVYSRFFDLSNYSSVDVNGLASGIYIVIIQSEAGNLSSRLAVIH